MGYTYDYSEFPHSDYDRRDMSELICMVEKLRNNYAGTLTEINNVRKRLDEYEANMNKKAEQAVANAMVQYNARIDRLVEDITRIERAANDLRNYVDEQDNTITALLRVQIDNVNATIANEISLVKSIINNQVEEINNRLERLDKKICCVRTELLTKIEMQNNRIDHINESTYADMIVRDTATLKKANDYTNTEIDRLQKAIDDLKLSTDTESIRWLWDNACNFGGYNAYQWYMDTSITAQEWSDTKFTALDWYIRGRELFHWFDRRTFMFSPVSGRRLPVQIVLYELANVLKEALTGSEYEKLLITAGQYDSKKLTGYQYDWYGKEQLNV